MNIRKTAWLLLPLLPLLAEIGHPRETSLTLPINDKTSAFNVMKNNGTGMFQGDGSGPSNVQSVVVFSKGGEEIRSTAPEISPCGWLRTCPGRNLLLS